MPNEYVFVRSFNGTTNGQLKYPEGVAVDSSGNVYVTDSSNEKTERHDRIQKFNNRAFYEFYHKYDVWTGTASNKSFTTDLQLLTAKIPLHNASAYGYEIIRIVYNVWHLLPKANVTVLTDGDLDEGRIFNTNTDSNSGIFIKY